MIITNPTKRDMLRYMLTFADPETGKRFAICSDETEDEAKKRLTHNQFLFREEAALKTFVATGDVTGLHIEAEEAV